MAGQRRRVRRLHIRLTGQSVIMMEPDGWSALCIIMTEADGLNVSPTIIAEDG